MVSNKEMDLPSQWLMTCEFRLFVGPVLTASVPTAVPLSTGQEMHGDWRLWVPGAAHGGAVAGKRLHRQCVRYAAGFRQPTGAVLSGGPLQSTGNGPTSLTYFSLATNGKRWTSPAQKPGTLLFQKNIILKNIKVRGKNLTNTTFLLLRVNYCHFYPYYFTLPW